MQVRSQGQPISGPLICEKALDMNKKLGGDADFKASTGWLMRFKSRHGIRELDILKNCRLILKQLKTTQTKLVCTGKKCQQNP